MATLTVRELDDELKARLRVRAARNGRSMEAEVREILRASLATQESQPDIGTRIRQRFANIEDTEIPLPERAEVARPAELPE